jgi:hypothetical protein
VAAGPAVVHPCDPGAAKAYLVSGLTVLSRDRACRVGVARHWFGGISPVVQARLHGFNASEFREPLSSDKDRRRAGRWDREQLIGGKAKRAS